MIARARRAAVLTLAPLSALLATADVSQERSNPAPLVEADALAGPLLVSRKQLGDVPYLQVRLPKPVRTIIYVHGGPLIPTLDGPTEFDRYLALRFRARVIKPVYYGSSERPPGGTAPSFNFEHPADLPKEEVEALVLRAVRSEYGGMTRAVEEVRRFVRQWDGPSTIVVGESAGSVIAALSAQAPHRSRMVLIGPMLASYQEIVTGAINGAYTKADPPDGPPRVLTDGKPGSKLFSTPEAQARYVWTRSLAYYEPWDGMDLGTMLRRVPGRVHVIVGLKDRTGMVTGGEWRRLLANAPKTTNVCVDPQLGHETPNGSETALRCFEQAMLAPNERI